MEKTVKQKVEQEKKRQKRDKNFSIANWNQGKKTEIKKSIIEMATQQIRNDMHVFGIGEKIIGIEEKLFRNGKNITGIEKR